MRIRIVRPPFLYKIKYKMCLYAFVYIIVYKNTRLFSRTKTVTGKKIFFLSADPFQRKINVV